MLACVIFSAFASSPPVVDAEAAATMVWSYTKLDHIEGLSTDELTALLDKDIVVIEIKNS